MLNREIEVCIISDVHLGTYGSHAKELTQYLKSIKPKKLILNGDIFDMWQFRKNYFPKYHMKVIQQVIKMASKGVEVYYITGNHDDLLRHFSDFNISNFHLVDKLILKIYDQKIWIFHGDIFDLSIKYTRFLAKLGGMGYDYIIRINRVLNHLLKYFGKQPLSFSKKIKNSVKKAIQYVDDFEQTAASLAIEQNYDCVICGHIHRPKKQMIQTDKGSVLYLNSGDWVENLTALEFYNRDWHIFEYKDADFLQSESEDAETEKVDMNFETVLEI